MPSNYERGFALYQQQDPGVPPIAPQPPGPGDYLQNPGQAATTPGNVQAPGLQENLPQQNQANNPARAPNVEAHPHRERKPGQVPGKVLETYFKAETNLEKRYGNMPKVSAPGRDGIGAGLTAAAGIDAAVNTSWAVKAAVPIYAILAPAFQALRWHLPAFIDGRRINPAYVLAKINAGRKPLGDYLNGLKKGFPDPENWHSLTDLPAGILDIALNSMPRRLANDFGLWFDDGVDWMLKKETKEKLDKMKPNELKKGIIHGMKGTIFTRSFEAAKSGKWDFNATEKKQFGKYTEASGMAYDYFLRYMKKMEAGEVERMQRAGRNMDDIAVNEEIDAKLIYESSRLLKDVEKQVQWELYKKYHAVIFGAMLGSIPPAALVATLFSVYHAEIAQLPAKILGGSYKTFMDLTESARAGLGNFFGYIFNNAVNSFREGVQNLPQFLSWIGNVISQSR